MQEENTRESIEVDVLIIGAGPAGLATAIKLKTEANKNNQELGQTKNSAKLVLFIFGIGPIIGIIIFLYSKGFFNSPNM